jgi:excisionase family DNA binding protein
VAEQLKLPEVARRLGVSEKTARRYVKSGALPSMFVGGAYRVSEEDLEGFLQGAKVTPSGGSPKAPRRSPSEPSFNDVLKEERRLSRFSEAIIGAAAKWGEAVAKPDMSDSKRFGIIDAALELSGVISERVEEEDWEAIPNQERLEIVTTMERLVEAASVGIRHAGEARDQEEEVKQRREQIREWTHQISA